MNPAVGTTYIRDILGGYYNTIIMPDGKEWMSENLCWTGAGSWYGDSAVNDGDGRYYNHANIGTLIAELAANGDGWRVPLYADTAALLSACYELGPGAAYLVNNMVIPNSRWDADGRVTNATNTTGFNAYPISSYSGYYGAWYPKVSEYPRAFYSTIPRDGYSAGMTKLSFDKGSGGDFTGSLGADGAGSYFLNDRMVVRLVRDAKATATATAIIDPPTGYSAGPVTVTATCATAGAVMHYTVDGSTPTEASPVLNGGIVLGSWISPAITLKVMASASGYNSSEAVSATYRFTAQAPMVSLQMQPESGYSFSAAESRKPRAFGACGKGIFKGTLQWELLDSEWPMYLEWWEAKQKGVQPFDIYCCTGDHATLHTFQAIETPSILRETGLRKVSIPVKLTNRPTGLAVGWGHALVGPPATYPPLVPMPQWGYCMEEASLYLSTSGAPTVARPVATRGELLSLEWKALSGFQFDMLVDWWSTYLGQGRRKFTISLPGETGPLLCQLVEDPAFTVEGVHFRGSMKVFAAPVRTLAPPPA